MPDIDIALSAPTGVNTSPASPLVVYVGIQSTPADEAQTPAILEDRAVLSRLAPARAAALLRGRSLAARMLASIGAPHASITRSPAGAPLADGYSISITHARNHSAAAVCVGSHGLGIDLEEWHTPTESQARRLGSRTDAQEFTKKWTMLEACSKATGIPLVLLIESARGRTPPHVPLGQPAASKTRECALKWRETRFVHQPSPAQHEMTLAVVAPGRQLVVRQWKETH